MVNAFYCERRREGGESFAESRRESGVRLSVGMGLGISAGFTSVVPELYNYRRHDGSKYTGL